MDMLPPRHVAIALLVLAAGCFAQRQMRAYHAVLDPQIARASEEDIARAWGPPTQRDSVGGTVFWTYYRDYGTSAIVRPGSLVTATTYERYDRVVLQFRHDTLYDWSADVRR